MEQRRFGRHPSGDVVLDVCWDCHAFWFDQYESSALAPGAVIDLFRLIHDHRNQPTRPLADAMACPHCRKKLAFTQDLLRTNRITYYRCPDGDGRFTTFFQFLREKQFVRSLSPVEIDSLKATVRQVRCSSCGATVDLAKDSACPYCRSPISVLDGEAVEKALATLAQAGRKLAVPEPDRIAAAFDQLAALQGNKPRESLWTRDVSSMQTAPVLVDLVIAGIGSLLQ
jgi:hypothetical protein